MTVGTGSRAVALVGLALIFAACGNGKVTTQGSSGSSVSGTGTSGGGTSGGGTSGGGSTGGGFGDCRDGGVDCADFDEYCDTANGQCVDCFDDAECEGSVLGSVCDTTTDTCVQCLTPSDCPYSFPGCQNELCGTCGSNSDCPANETCTSGLCTCTTNAGCGGDAPACVGTSDGGPGACGCTDSSQCPTGEICNPNTLVLNGICVPPCTSDAGACVAGSSAAFCDSSTGLCVPCLSNAQCIAADAGILCLSGIGCGNCESDSACTNPAMPYCLFGTCVQCGGPQNCPPSEPGCNFVTNTCGSCTLNSDCTPLGCLDGACVPLCGQGALPDGGCAQCNFASDCDAGDCGANGFCE